MPFWVTFTLTLASGIISRCLYPEHICFITDNFPRMCLMLDHFLWGHLSCDCDISCLFVWFSLFLFLLLLILLFYYCILIFKNSLHMFCFCKVVLQQHG